MHKFVRNLITEWRRLDLPLEGGVVVGVSGGADSAALLAAMADLKDRKKHRLEIIAAHFNHGLRGNASDADEAAARDMADKFRAQFVRGGKRIAKRGNLEQNARVARYDFLAEAASDAGAAVVLTGHTMNDQAESFLLNLIRGSGPDGLAAMPPVRPLQASSAIVLVRPLLRWAKRADTEGFCMERGIDYRTDEMNLDHAFSRVRVRRELIPQLQKYNPRIVETLAATASLMPSADQRQPLDDETLSVAELKILPQAEAYDLLRRWLRGRRGSLRGLTMKHIEAVHRLISSRKSGRTVEIPGGYTVSKAGGRLVFAEIKVEN